jgi:hypothetical protein
MKGGGFFEIFVGDLIRCSCYFFDQWVDLFKLKNG